MNRSLSAPARDTGVWSGFAPLVNCTTLHRLVYIFHCCNNFNKHILRLYRYSPRKHCGETGGGSPVAFSSRWKHFSTAAAVALETWSLSLFYPQSSLLASLSVLLPAIRIKPAAGLAGCLEMQSPIKYFQIATFLQPTSALYIIKRTPGSLAFESRQHVGWIGKWLQNVQTSPQIKILRRSDAALLPWCVAEAAPRSNEHDKCFEHRRCDLWKRQNVWVGQLRTVTACFRMAWKAEEMKRPMEMLTWKWK